MRIAILTNAFPPDGRGGAGQIAWTQADWFVRHGHTVGIWIPTPFSGGTASGDRLAVHPFSGRTTVRFADLSRRGPLARLFFHLEDLSPNLGVVDDVQRWRPDVLLTHNLTGCGWGTPRMLKLAGIRWVHLLHDVQMFEPSGQIRYRESFAFFRFLWRSGWARLRARTFGEPDAVISPSAWLMDTHRAFGLFADTATAVIGNPIGADVERDDAALRHPVQDTADILCIGRVSEDKGALTLLDAWKRLVPRPGHLTFIGDGPATDVIRQANDPSVTVAGPLAHDRAMDRLRQADLLVFPSLIMENQPTVLLEAVAAGVRIVATDVGGVRPLIERYGTVVPPGDAAALAQAIAETLNKPLPDGAQERILADHGTDQVMERLTDVISSHQTRMS